MAAATFAILATIVGGGLWTAWSGRPVNINVRWRDGLSVDARVMLERRFRLAGASNQGETTWSYRLDDPSTSNIEALVLHEAVVDTAHLNRERFRPELSQDGARQAVAYALAVGALGGLLAFVLAGRRRDVASTRTQAEDAARKPRLNQIEDTAPDLAFTLDAPTSRGWAWSARVLLVSTPLLVPLCTAMWKTPFPIGETVGLLEDIDGTPFRDVGTFFDPEGRSWYRPLFHFTLWTAWRGTDQVVRAFDQIRVLELAAVIGLVVLFVRFLRPRALVEAAAAAFALMVLIGTPGLRDNLEVPMLMTLVGMPLGLAVWMLGEHRDRWWHSAVVVVLLLVAIGYKEQGLVIAPLVVAAWWMGAPGASGRTAAATVAATVAYLALRFGHTGNWPVFEQELGLLFDELSAADAVRRFGDAPYGMYAYNALATTANLLLSEPTRGRFAITSHALEGTIAPWEVNHVLSSLAASGLFAWWGTSVVRRDWSAGAWTRESRLAVATALAIASSGALGFMYSRDRLGGMAAVFYAASLYFAARLAAERARRARRLVPIALGLGALALSWQLRAVGTLEETRSRSEKNQREWIISLEQLRYDFADRPRYLSILEAMVEQGRDPGAARRAPYPDWARAWLGER
jgi:hypothetical protein